MAVCYTAHGIESCPDRQFEMRYFRCGRNAQALIKKIQQIKWCVIKSLNMNVSLWMLFFFSSCLGSHVGKSTDIVFLNYNQGVLRVNEILFPMEEDSS